ncbi:hypothetical protein [Emticicia sp. 17c]|uniref:hypothetical protein n=1 Tax=Emticicia sp. 17c TaxID=3127704 RepID=UPI00301CFD9D
MSHFFFILVQVPYIILSLLCGISVVISNWNEFVASKVPKEPKTVYMLVESTEDTTEEELDLAPMAA